MPSVSFRELQLMTILLLIRNSSLKLSVGFSIFDSLSILLKFIFLFNKKNGLFEFKTSYFLSK